MPSFLQEFVHAAAAATSPATPASPYGLLNLYHLLKSHLLQGTFLPSFLTFFALYLLLSRAYHTSKQRSWIISTAASALMTLASLPFVLDYLISKGSVSQVQSRYWEGAVLRAFQGYLAADLTVGSIFYRDQISLLTGWIHHILYIAIVQIAISNRLENIFCFASIMELPTFVLAIASLHPRWRSNTLFAVTFFLTRIVFHLILIVSYALPANRALLAGRSYIPSVVLSIIFPLHAMWFKGCVQGFLKRRKQRLQAKMEKEASKTVTQVAVAVSSTKPTPIPVNLHTPQPSTPHHPSSSSSTTMIPPTSPPRHATISLPGDLPTLTAPGSPSHSRRLINALSAGLEQARAKRRALIEGTASELKFATASARAVMMPANLNIRRPSSFGLRKRVAEAFASGYGYGYAGSEVVSTSTSISTRKVSSPSRSPSRSRTPVQTYKVSTLKAAREVYAY